MQLDQVSGAELRAAVRNGYTGLTSGLASGYTQSNVVILPAEYAEEFAAYCAANPDACPLIAQTAPGDPEVRDLAPGSDVRTEVPRYRVFRDGVASPEEPTEIGDLWRDDFVTFLIGCSFTFERTLQEAGLRIRHIDLGRNVPMFRTNIDSKAAGRFSGAVVVTMRPFPDADVERVVKITKAFGDMHGAPLHIGDPEAIGITDLAHPDFGEGVPVEDGETPMFWACGLTAQVAMAAARPDIAITHSPGRLFVTDLPDTPGEQA
jgi:uncharacterized protein YcsI (UPF0317 family)